MQAIFGRTPHWIEHPQVQLLHRPAVGHLHLIVHVYVDICLVNDFILQNLLHYILQCEHANRVELGVGVHLRVCGTHESHVRTALLEDGQNLHQLSVLEQRLHLAAKDLDEVPELHLIVGVCEHQVLGVEEPFVVVLVLAVHGYAAEPSLEDLADVLVAQGHVHGEHVGVLEWSHHLRHRLVAEAECAFGDSLGHLTLLVVASAEADL
mmetsp:Transcript_53775/g.172393  ORF Transcript_53775/g.172393 Transcript_53775/m.172393 type:complete len:208 (+) Transcript_53775:736-1359(+)